MSKLKATLYNKEPWQSFHLDSMDGFKMVLHVRSTAPNFILWNWRIPKGTLVFRRRYGAPDKPMPCMPGTTNRYDLRGQSKWESLIFTPPAAPPLIMDVLSVSPSKILVEWDAPIEVKIVRQ